MTNANVLDLQDADEIIIREVFRRLGPKAHHDTVRFQEHVEEVANEQAETIYAQLSDAAHEQLRMTGLRISEQIARLERINEVIAYGRFLIATFKAKTLGSYRKKTNANLHAFGWLLLVARRCERIKRT